MVQMPLVIVYILLDSKLLPWGPYWAHAIDLWALALPSSLLFITYV